MKAIEVNNLSKTFHLKDMEVKALDNVSFSIEEGEMVAIIGASGSGKTTLLNIIGLLDRQDEGTLRILGESIDFSKDTRNAKIRNENIGFVFQDYSLIANENAIFNVMLPLFFSKIRLSKMKKKALDSLDEVGFPKTHVKNKVKYLSGGQKQRAAIARALVTNPKIILADEPTGALDSQNTKSFMELLKKLNAEGKTIIIVTHDPAVAENCGRKILIADGKVEC